MPTGATREPVVSQGSSLGQAEKEREIGSLGSIHALSK